MSTLRKYGAATTIVFPLIDAGAADFEATPVTFAAGDCLIAKDEGAFANTGSLAVTETNGFYSIALTATEMQAARIMIAIIDQTATKLWEDQGIIIETYGNASAQHAFDFDAATQSVDLEDGAITSAKFATGAITATVLADDCIAAAKFADNAIAAAAIATGAITADAIAADAITAAKIADDAITAASLATDAFGSDVLATTFVNEIRDAIVNFVMSEPAQGAPPLGATLVQAVYLLYIEHVRNKVTQDGTEKAVFADDGTTVLYKKATAKAGSTLTVSEAVTGP